MNDATLQGFRNMAAAMLGEQNWQWIGPHMSQRMFGISKERAERYAAAHGGEAKEMPTEAERQEREKLAAMPDWDNHYQ